MGVFIDDYVIDLCSTGSDDALQTTLRRGQASSAQLAARVKVQPFQDVPQKLLYKLVEPDGGRSVVKFATRYSEEAHRALAAQKLAPELLEVRRLPGGWFQIHMELLDAPWCSLLEILRSEYRDVVLSAWKAAEEALARAHAIMLEEGQLVWGDARPSNFRLHAHAWQILHRKLRVICGSCAANAWLQTLLLPLVGFSEQWTSLSPTRCRILAACLQTHLICR